MEQNQLIAAYGLIGIGWPDTKQKSDGIPGWIPVPN